MELFKDRVGDPTTDEGKQVAGSTLAAAQGRRNQAAAVDRPGRERSARQAGRGRSNRQGHAGEEDSGHLRALPRRRARLRRPEINWRSPPFPKRSWRRILADATSRSAMPLTVRRSPCPPVLPMFPGYRRREGARQSGSEVVNLRRWCEVAQPQTEVISAYSPTAPSNTCVFENRRAVQIP